MIDTISKLQASSNLAGSCDPRLVSFTGGHEGKVLRWYRDPTGTPTIGFGFTWASKIFRQWFLAKYGREMRAGDTLSEDDAIMLLQLVIEAEYLPPVIQRAGKAATPLTRHAVSAATDMSYNCGPGALAWSWFLLLLQGKVKEAAARYAVTATTSKGRKLPGLVRRRKEGALILERNIWPSWVRAPQTTAGRDIAKALPAWRLLPEDYAQGLTWLKDLGYVTGDMGDPNVIKAAILAFQTEHPQLTNDGILGRATLDQLQRVTDLKKKLAVTTVAGGGTAGAGSGSSVTGHEVTGIDGWLLGLGGAVIVAGALYLGWRYRDEIAIAVRSLVKRKEKRS